jgi:uncharacterized heparinase superfamily protein
MQRLLRLSRSILHTPPRQLAARAWRVGERRVRAGIVEVLGAPPPLLAEEPLAPVARLPRAVYAPRLHLVARRGGSAHSGAELCLCFLNLETPLCEPIDWHPPAWERGTRLEKLHLHYMEWLEAVPDEMLPRVVEDWITRNPPWRDGWWRDSWNSYALSIRCVVWLQELARRGERLAPATRRLALRSLVAQMRFLVAHLELDIGGNHLIKNIKALLWAARCFDAAEARAWGALGERLLARELDAQLLSDGMHYERSPAYHLQVLADLVECRSVLPVGALRQRLDQCLASMAQVAADLTHPDGRPSLYNDGGLHMTYAPDAVLDAYARVTGAAPPRARTLFALPEAGYYGWRAFDANPESEACARYGSDFVLLDAGPVGPAGLPAHAHGDILAFEWSAGGRRIAVDPGVFEYHAGARRAWSRSTAAHNTVCVAGLDQCEFYSSFRVGRRARVRVREARLESQDDSQDGAQDGAGAELASGLGGRLLLEAAHDGYAHLAARPVHVRRTQVDRGGISIEDELELRQRGARGLSASSGVLLHPDVEVDVRGARARLHCAGRSYTLSAHTALRLEPAVFAPDFGVLVPTLRLSTPLVEQRGRLRIAHGERAL